MKNKAKIWKGIILIVITTFLGIILQYSIDNYWIVFFFFNTIVLISASIYLYYTNQLKSFLSKIKKGIIKTNLWLVSTVMGIILLSAISTKINGYIFPSQITNFIEKMYVLKDGQDEIKEEVYKIQEGQDVIKKILETKGMGYIDPRDIKKYLEKLPLTEGEQKCYKQISDWYIEKSISSEMNIALIYIIEYIFIIIKDSQELPFKNPELQNQIEKYLLQFKYKKARQVVDDAIGKYNKVAKDLAMLHYQKSLTYTGEFNYLDAEKEIKKAIALDDQNVLIINEYGVILIHLSKYNDAIKYHKRNIDLQLKSLNINYSNLSKSYINLSSSYIALGKLEKAKESILKALSINKKHLGKDNSVLASTYNNLSVVLMYLGSFIKAKEYALNSLTIREKVLNKGHPHLANTYSNLSAIHMYLGNYKKAEKYALNSLSIWKKGLNKDHSNKLTYGYNNVAVIYMSLGNYKKAEKYALKSIIITEKAFGKNHPNTAYTYNNIAIAYYLSDDCNKAKNYNNKAIKIMMNYYSKSHPNLEYYYVLKNNIAKKCK